MKISDDFKFLSLQAVKRKNTEELKPEEQFFYIINLLDKENNPVKFYSFDNNINSQLIKSINSGELKGLQDCLVHFELLFSNNNWNVKLINIEYV